VSLEALVTRSFVGNDESSLIATRLQLLSRSPIGLIIDYENVYKCRHNGKSSDDKMSKMTMTMDVDVMLAPTLRCLCDVDVERPISIKHLSPPPFAVTILRGEDSRIATPGSPPERRKR